MFSHLSNWCYHVLSFSSDFPLSHRTSKPSEMTGCSSFQIHPLWISLLLLLPHSVYSHTSPHTKRNLLKYKSGQSVFPSCLDKVQSSMACRASHELVPGLSGHLRFYCSLLTPATLSSLLSLLFSKLLSLHDHSLQLGKLFCQIFLQVSA